MFAGNFERFAKNNTNFRQVLHTGQHSQVVAMSLLVDENIGAETHPSIDQIFIVANGEGEAMVGDDTRRVEEGDIVFVPSGTAHDISNTGHKDLKLITIYSPAAHPDGTVHATKADAQRAEY